jgi:3-oxoacyl-[acyl-carrier-protein] synthase II
VTPLGCGVELTWQRLIEGQCGIRAIRPEDLRIDGVDEATSAYTYEQLPSKVAAAVPHGTGGGEFDEEAWLQGKVRNCLCTLSSLQILSLYKC